MTKRLRKFMKDEKSERWHIDPLRGAFLSLILIFTASIYLFRASLPGVFWWAWAAVGIGCLFLLEAVVRSARSKKGFAMGKAMTGIIFIVVGVGFVYGFEYIWPLSIIAVGFFMMGYYMRHIGEKPAKKTQTEKTKPAASRTVTCPVCRNEIQENWISCPYCGVNLDDETQIY